VEENKLKVKEAWSDNQRMNLRKIMAMGAFTPSPTNT